MPPKSETALSPEIRQSLILSAGLTAMRSEMFRVGSPGDMRLLNSIMDMMSKGSDMKQLEGLVSTDSRSPTHCSVCREPIHRPRPNKFFCGDTCRMKHWRIRKLAKQVQVEQS